MRNTGMENTFKAPCDRAAKMALGRNSAKTKIIRVETTVCTRSKPTEELIPILIRNGSKAFPINIPYSTKAILFPMSIAAIKRDGFCNNPESIRDRKSPLLLSTSILKLLDEINAISIPEKKADSTMVRTIRPIKEYRSMELFHFFSLLPAEVEHEDTQYKEKSEDG